MLTWHSARNFFFFLEETEFIRLYVPSCLYALLHYAWLIIHYRKAFIHVYLLSLVGHISA